MNSNIAVCFATSTARSRRYCSRSSSWSLIWNWRTCLNSAISDEEETTVFVMLLTGADAVIDADTTLTAEGGVLLEDEDDKEDGTDIEGGPEPAAVM